MNDADCDSSIVEGGGFGIVYFGVYFGVYLHLAPFSAIWYSKRHLNPLPRQFR
jgi:hypothetical protein